MITFIKDRPGHDRRYAIDNTKIQEELNWQPKETFNSGIFKTVSWYLKIRTGFLKNKKVMLLGSQGQLGLEILYELKNKYNLYAFSRNELDITDNANLKNVILSIKPDFVINCAAYTGVDKAENEKQVCLDINSNSVEELAKLSASEDFVLIHFSTDYIFNAKSSQPIKEEHSPDPINFYGYTKLLGENHIKSLSKCFFIFRISWVFGKHGENFQRKLSLF